MSATRRRSRKGVVKSTAQPALSEDVALAPPADQTRIDTSTATVTPPLANLPPELLDEVVSHWETLPLRFYYDTSDMQIAPDLRYATRTVSLRALSQTCRALRTVCLPRLWSRLETCWVPIWKRTKWFTHVMLALKRIVDGVLSSDPSLSFHVRTLCIMTTKAETAITIPAISKLLPALPNLHTIHILHCGKAGQFKAAVKGLHLPSVRTVIIPTECNSILKSCPNVTHVRCAGGNGAALVSALKFCKVQTLDGMFDWGFKSIMDRLIKAAPLLHTLEIRRPVSWGLGFESQNKAPAVWAEVIPSLAKLPALRVLQLTFPGSDEQASDLVSIEAARKVLRETHVQAQKKLIIARVLAPHYTRLNQDDVVHSVNAETFN